MSEIVSMKNSTRVEFSAPELKGQLPGQTSLFVEGYAEEPQEQGQDEPENSKRLEFSGEETPEEEPEKFQTFGKTDEDPFVGLPQETEIYADKLVKESRELSEECSIPNEIVPYDVQVRVHKRQAIVYIETMATEDTLEDVEHFFNVAIKQLVVMRAYKLKSLKGAKK